MSSPTLWRARVRRGAAAALLLTLTLTPAAAMAAPLAGEAGPRSAVLVALDILGAWWRVIADVVGGNDRTDSQDTARGGAGDGREVRPRRRSIRHLQITAVFRFR